MSEPVLKAWDLASDYHDQQMYGNFPYLYHLIKVVERVREKTDDEDIIIAAILHDIVEDTEITRDDVRGQFGVKVAEIVDFLTHRYYISYTEYLQRVMLNEGAILIKICDLEENLSNSPNTTQTEKYLNAINFLTQ